MSEAGGTNSTTGGAAGTGGIAGESATGGSANGGIGGASATGGSGANGGTGGASGSGGSGALSGSSGSGAVGGIGGISAVGGAAGTVDTSGSAGMSGSGADPSPCVAGGMCTIEGAACSGSECCPCPHICHGGVWTTEICSACPAPTCPESPPANGDACNACSVPTDPCQWTGIHDGLLYAGSCVAGQWAVTKSAPPACCMSDGDCGHSVCPPDVPNCVRNACVNGACKTAANAQCWRDDQCSAPEACSGAFVCGCAADCSKSDHPGQCIGRGSGCCFTDADCGANSWCIAGVCKDALTEGCYRDTDCAPSGTCKGASVCPCGITCPTEDSVGGCSYAM
jgi:hypothetical protein